MSKRAKRTLLIAAIVLILAIILLLLLLRRPPAAPELPPAVTQPPTQAGLLPSTTTRTELPPAPVETTPTAAPAAEPAGGANLRRLAAAFAERFGSYTNQSRYENITDLKVFMTEAMAAWADNYVQEALANTESSAVYAGTATRAISTELVELDESAGKARVLVRTQRAESAGTSFDRTVGYQDIMIAFDKVGASWLVDEATWQSGESAPGSTPPAP